MRDEHTNCKRRVRDYKSASVRDDNGIVTAGKPVPPNEVQAIRISSFALFGKATIERHFRSIGSVVNFDLTNRRFSVSHIAF